MKKTLFALLILFCCSSLNVSYSQKNSIYNDPEAGYRKGLELFDKEKYNAAREFFNKTIETVTDVQSEIRISSEYYAAICAVELYHNDAEYKLLKFINSHPENSKVKLAYFQLGKLQYRQKKYSEAVKIFETIDIYDLNEDELTEYYFKSGYCYFVLNDFDKAKKQFFEITEIDTKYFGAANYYYAHVSYNDKNYETALISFQRIKDNETFGAVVPYYIAQIYYLQENYEEVIKYVPPLLDSGNTKRMDEIARILGESYFKTGNYKNAIPYLEKYRDKTSNPITRQDYYELGYAYYKSGMNYTKAIDNLEKAITAGQDSLTQNTYYLLGDCYLKNGNKNFAMNSFLSAYKFSFYPDIREDALFNYAKLAYELGLNPYNEAITSFQKFISDYPNSSKIDEANTYLVNLFFTTKNYKDALFSIEKIKSRDDKLNRAYQKIAYYRGVELFNNKDIDGAMILFDKSNTQPFDKSVKAQCVYWKGEGFYRLSQFDSAFSYYNSFLLLPGAFSLENYNTAYYNIGYCYFKQKNYTPAINNFRKFVANKSKESNKILNDAYLRIGDCYFISKEYANAAEFYDKAVALKSFDTDYALFQKALCQNAQGRYDSQIITILEMLTQYPHTTYADDALYELSNAYLMKNDNDNALNYYKKLISEYPNSSYIKKTMLKIGTIYRNTDKDDLAINTFKKIVMDYPSTETSKDALEYMQKIYMDMDKVDSFYVWVQKRGIEYGSKTQQDSVNYIVIESRYMSGDCEKAVDGFNNYIQSYPNGYFVTNARYYKAECDYKNNNMEEALNGYSYVASQPQNKFSEDAILKAAGICYKLNRYDSAANFYSALEQNADYKSNITEARIMKMRCYREAGDYNKAVKAARALLVTDKVANELLAEAHITIGRAALGMDSIALAQTEFEFTFKQSPASEFGAEAKYNIAYIQYKLNDYTNAEKTIFEVINLVPSYDYWVAKSFILLADIYEKTDNRVQAKATLQSIIDNYDGTDLVTIAHEKLNAINKIELMQEQEKKQQEEIEIKFDQNPKNDKLFEDNNNKPGEEKKNE